MRADRVPSRATWPPAWLAASSKPQAEPAEQRPDPEFQAEREAIQAEGEPLPAGALDFPFPAEAEPDPPLTWDSDSLLFPSECSACGSIQWWWCACGNKHCMTCRPPKTARRILRIARRIRGEL